MSRFVAYRVLQHAHGAGELAGAQGWRALLARADRAPDAALEHADPRIAIGACESRCRMHLTDGCTRALDRAVLTTELDELGKYSARVAAVAGRACCPWSLHQAVKAFQSRL